MWNAIRALAARQAQQQPAPATPIAPQTPPVAAQVLNTLHPQPSGNTGMMGAAIAAANAQRNQPVAPQPTPLPTVTPAAPPSRYASLAQLLRNSRSRGS